MAAFSGKERFLVVMMFLRRCITFVNVTFSLFIPVEMGVMPEIAQAVEEMEWL